MIYVLLKQSRIRIKGTGIKGKASPETEPDFYSMPWAEHRDASTALNEDLEGEVVAALEEEHKHNELTTKRLTTKRQQTNSKKKQQASKRISGKKKSGVETEYIYSSPRSGPQVSPPAVITPDTRGTKPELVIPSSFFEEPPSPIPSHSIFHRRRSLDMMALPLMDLCPPLLSSDSEDTADSDPQSGEEIAFEGQHFHYLDSFARRDSLLATSSHFLTLVPRKNIISAQQRIPELVMADSSSSSVSIVQSLREPIMTPSSSSSSLRGMPKHDESVEINPDTIFAENVDGDWQVGENADEGFSQWLS